MKKITVFLSTLPLFAFAQLSTPTTQDLQLALSEANETNCTMVCPAQDELDLPQLKHPAAKLKLAHETRSLVGVHRFYLQEVYGIPVWNGYVKINTGKSGRIISVFNHLTNVSSWPQQLSDAINPDRGKPYLLNVNGAPVTIYEYQNNDHKIVTDRNGNILQQTETRLYFANDDTTVTGKVFRPDPLTPSGLVYGQGGLLHYNDSDYAAINDKRVQVSFPATWMNDSFYLENKFVRVADYMPPYNGRAVKKSPQFDYNRKSNEFKEVMALYHISNLQAYMNSIGLDSLVPYQLRVDAHSGTGDVSSFTYSPDTLLNFGLGGVPDAEDADVIVHEYSHAISHSLNPAGITGTERRALEEANCDIIAALYSREYAPFNWRYMFNWDAPNPVTNGEFPFWSGRNANSNKKYSNKTGDFYSDSEIWSSTILDIGEEVNREMLTKLLLVSMYSYTPNTNMFQAAQLFMQADSLLYGKSNSWKMGKYFVDRELGDFSTSVSSVYGSPLSFTVINSVGFAEGESPLTIVFPYSGHKTIQVFDLTGKRVLSQRLESDKYTIHPDQLQKGVYLIVTETEKGKETIKLMR